MRVCKKKSCLLPNACKLWNTEGTYKNIIVQYVQYMRLLRRHDRPGVHLLDQTLVIVIMEHSTGLSELSMVENGEKGMFLLSVQFLNVLKTESPQPLFDSTDLSASPENLADCLPSIFEYIYSQSIFDCVVIMILVVLLLVGCMYAPVPRHKLWFANRPGEAPDIPPDWENKFAVQAEVNQQLQDYVNQLAIRVHKLEIEAQNETKPIDVTNAFAKRVVELQRNAGAETAALRERLDALERQAAQYRAEAEEMQAQLVVLQERLASVEADHSARTVEVASLLQCSNAALMQACINGWHSAVLALVEHPDTNQV